MTDNLVPESAPFKVADVVHLISGSPRLTVIKVDGDLITCAWFSYPDNHAHTIVFPSSALYRHVYRNAQQPIQSNQAGSWDTDEPDFLKETPASTPNVFKRKLAQDFGNADPSQETPF